MRRSVLRLTAMLAVFPGFATIAPHATAADPTLLFDGEIVAEKTVPGTESGQDGRPLLDARSPGI